MISELEEEMKTPKGRKVKLNKKDRKGSKARNLIQDVVPEQPIGMYQYPQGHQLVPASPSSPAFGAKVPVSPDPQMYAYNPQQIQQQAPQQIQQQVVPQYQQQISQQYPQQIAQQPVHFQSNVMGNQQGQQPVIMAQQAAPQSLLAQPVEQQQQNYSVPVDAAQQFAYYGANKEGK